MRKNVFLRIVIVIGLLAALTGTLASCKKENRKYNAHVCKRLLVNSNAYVKAAQNSLLACKTDADCTTLNVSTKCTGDCDVAIAKTQIRAMKATLITANDKWCGKFQAKRCPRKKVKCAVAKARCKKGMCTLK